MAVSLLILNGPGTATPGEKDTAGSMVPALEDIRRLCQARCDSAGIHLDFRQSDDADELCEVMETEQANYDALLLNPYSLSGSSMAAADAYNAALARLEKKDLSIVELHLTNILAEFDPANPPLQGPAGRTGLVCGMGSEGYALAISALARDCQQTIDRASDSMKVAVLNGPNLNLLGTREPEVYGYDTLEDIRTRCQTLAGKLGLEIEFRQSNHEGEIIDWIQQAIGNTDAIVINPAGFTHTSVAIHDALKAYMGYKVELHISNPHLREAFRHRSYVSLAADAVVVGLGVSGYEAVLGMLPQVMATSPSPHSAT